MARQQGIKRARTQTKNHGSLNQNQSDDEGAGRCDHQETHPSKKKVRWDSGADDSSANDQDDSDDESASLQQTCLAASCQHGNIGCAYYDPVKCRIYVLEDTQESPHFDLSKMQQADPDVVLTSSKADDNFMDILRDHMEASGGVFQIRPHRDFVPSKGRDRLLSLRLLSELPFEDMNNASSDLSSNSEPRNAYEFMRRQQETGADPTLKRWNASIRLSNFASVESSPLCMSSIGALLDHLTRQRAVGELDDEGLEGLEIRDIEALTLDQVMQINADALFSLQIFENESHASVHSDKTKEGLSLFGILNNTASSLGRSLLRTWLLRPSLSIPVITARHDAVACFLRPENLVTAAAMHSHLKGIKNVPRILGTMRCGKAGVGEWQGLVKFTFHSAMIRDALNELHQAGSVEIVQKLLAALDVAGFREVASAVNEIIDWEESANACRVCVRSHIDEELDNKKHVYHGIDSVLCKVADQICQIIPPNYASSLNVVYFPQLGFLICVPMLDEWKGDDGIQVLDGWSFQFSSESHVYFKSQEMRDMDIHIGDLHPSIVDREIEIVQELQSRILVYDKAIGHACDVCAELDVLLSFAEASRGYDYRQPRMVNESVIDIVGGRHPLQEQAVDTFVPNSASLVGGAGTNSQFAGYRDQQQTDCTTTWNSVVVCTGANACGKSVYLKQIGCFVPAESATLGIVDKIFTRIQTRESVSKAQSAFMIDLNQVSLALRNCTARSLVILDEFGKGTRSTDGAGLFCGVLKHLLDRGSNCPKVLAATHFHEVFRTDLFDFESVPVTFLHMQVMFTTTNGALSTDSNGSTLQNRTENISITPQHQEEDDESLLVGPGERITYLYRVANGLSLDSHAAQCAEIFGIPQRVVERARYVTHLLAVHELGQLLDEEITEAETNDLKEAEMVCRRFLAWNLEGTETNGCAKAKLAEVLMREVS
ncbi:hypothetical protein PILCRDRAFT_211886 [Piloderma croceum F 1598]|uniref:DNA mismatch repair proteins mutS family domain-containing protein n=1 Tax=Piloderma croceum (strain F 1598) TaxID=765440 RepID=A0A0C3GEN4_PILCF|nr:hypothetical protein PILCRDRAFT_211886 [Piloderma croceum F 1598]